MPRAVASMGLCGGLGAGGGGATLAPPQETQCDERSGPSHPQDKSAASHGRRGSPREEHPRPPGPGRLLAGQERNANRGGRARGPARSQKAGTEKSGSEPGHRTRHSRQTGLRPEVAPDDPEAASRKPGVRTEWVVRESPWTHAWLAALLET